VFGSNDQKIAIPNRPKNTGTVEPLEPPL